MAGRGSKSAQQRTEAERARLHAARTSWHEGQVRRRTRDNAVAVIVGALVVAGAVASQVAYAQVNPPAPAPTPTVEQTDAPAPTESTTPLPTDLPTDAPAE
ncbi:hypothetical protein JOF42_002305 [Microbacterium phyllosphaerae]|uniref:Dioxygenase n=1 Tax=Microbacterium phyllosphaerae TaxID=124798 RepID=A0ABS4WRG8_9MICO|nr:hypothetical protein [Microbacterium phyllosphaerae]MBP2378810.1 hypothetical protein [Microbacterium phyllosphaerae]